MQPILANDTTPWHTIKKHYRLNDMKDRANPTASFFTETTTLENTIQSRPIDIVKGLLEVKIQDNRGGFAQMTTLNKIGDIEKVVGDSSPANKPGL